MRSVRRAAPPAGQAGSPCRRGSRSDPRHLAANGAVVAEAFGALREGDSVGGADCQHPNPSGNTKIAEAVAAAYSG